MTNRWYICQTALRGIAILSALCCLAGGRADATQVTLRDTTNALAAAIEQAGPGGTVILQGTVVEEQTVEIPYRIHLRGARWNGKVARLILTPTDRLNGLVILADDVQISSLRIEPLTEDYGNLGTMAYVLGQRLRLMQSAIVGWRVGLYLDGTASEVWVAGNEFTASPLNQDPDYLGAGIYSQFAARTVRVVDNRFRGYQVAVFVQDSSGHMVSSNEAEGNLIAFWLDGALQSRVTGNQVRSSGAAAILLTEGATGIDVSNNGISGSAGDSVLLEAGTTGNQVRSNRVDKPVKDEGVNRVQNNPLG